MNPYKIHGAMKTLIPLLLALFSLLPFAGHAQNAAIEKLQQRLKATGQDTNRVKILNPLSDRYRRIGAYDSARAYAMRARALAVQLDFPLGVATSYLCMGYIFHFTSDYDKARTSFRTSMGIYDKIGNAKGVSRCCAGMALDYSNQGNYQKALALYRASLKINILRGDSTGISAVYGNIGLVNYRLGDYPEALKNHLKSLELDEAMKNKAGMANSYSNIGGIYIQEGEYQKALKNFNDYLKIVEDMKNKVGVANGNINIGSLYIKQGKYDQALGFLLKGLDISTEINNKYRMSMCYLGLSEVYCAYKKYIEALRNAKKALHISEQLEDKNGMASAYWVMGNTLSDSNENKEASVWFQKALKIFKELGGKENIKESYGRMAHADSALGNYKSAFANYKMYTLYKDSLFNEENTKKLTQTAMRYEFGKKTMADSLRNVAEQRSMGAKLEQQKTARNGILGGALLLLAGGGAWMYSDRKRRRERSQKKVAELETQVLRSQMNPHFIFNALNSINSFVQHNDADGASTYLSKFAKVMRGVLENSRHAEVTLRDDLETLRGYMELERQRMENKFDFTITVDPAIDPEQVMVPPLVVQPLVENAIWHGIAGKEGHGHIALNLMRQGDRLVWSIEDDGVGRKATVPAQTPTGTVGGKSAKRTSLGTAITRGRLELLRQRYGGLAGLRYEDLPQGTRAVVDMPVIMA